MKYISLIDGDERVWGMSTEQMEQIYADHRAFGEAMAKAAVMVGGSEEIPRAAARRMPRRCSGGDGTAAIDR